MDLENKVAILYLKPKNNNFNGVLRQQGFRYIMTPHSSCFYKKIELQNYAIHESIVYNPAGFVYIEGGVITLCVHRAMFIPVNREITVSLIETALNEFKDMLSNLFTISYEETK